MAAQDVNQSAPEIRKAAINDVPDLGAIINSCAEYGLMLHRSHAYLYEHARDFHVAADAASVVGTCGLSIVWAQMAEVYSLAVAPEARGRGLGRRLVEACLEEARQLGLAKIFCLTYEHDFFRKFGFQVVDREQLPLKVWSECVRCLKNQSCDEIAMVRVLEDVPPIDAPQPESPQADEYVVPVTLNVAQPAHRRKKMSKSP